MGWQEYRAAYIRAEQHAVSDDSMLAWQSVCHSVYQLVALAQVMAATSCPRVSVSFLFYPPWPPICLPHKPPTPFPPHITLNPLALHVLVDIGFDVLVRHQMWKRDLRSVR